MPQTHVVYPGDLAADIERQAENRDMSVSAWYTEAARQKLRTEADL